MKNCTFFGHRDTPEKIEPILQLTLRYLIENENVKRFFMGNQGNFDAMARRVLKRLELEYKDVSYYIMLAYLPRENEINDYDNWNTIYPWGMENTPPRYAIDKRNKILVRDSHYVVTYVKHNCGGAAKFKALAERKNKIVINLADLESD